MSYSTGECEFEKPVDSKKMLAELNSNYLLNMLDNTDDPTTGYRLIILRKSPLFTILSNIATEVFSAPVLSSKIVLDKMEKGTF